MNDNDDVGGGGDEGDNDAAPTLNFLY